MTYFKSFELPADAGFQVVAGRPDGLRRLMVVSGRLPADTGGGPVHAHLGTLFPVRQPDGTRRLVEVYRADLPWCAPPPQPGRYTTDEELQEIIGSVDIEV